MRDSKSALSSLQAIDWGSLASLRLHAKSVAEGVYAGAHRSVRRGPGVEFFGHRQYVPGDDLRWIDRHALMRHDRLIVREFEMETDRALHLIVDATASMGFRGAHSSFAKIAFCALIAASLARIAEATGDPVSLSFVGGHGTRDLPPQAGGEAFERVVRSLSSIQSTGDASADPKAFERALMPVARRIRRGQVVVLLSDLIDLPPQSEEHFAALAGAGRRLVAVQTLDREELELPYAGTVRLRSLEGGAVVETTPDESREGYTKALKAIESRWSEALIKRGARLVTACTDTDAIDVVRKVLRAVAQGAA
jgi:uncharacterized protein (DUF58 family)